MLRFRILLFLFVLGSSVVLTGCMKGEQTLEEIDVPEDVTVIDEEEEGKDKDGATEEDAEKADDEVVESDETVSRDIYLLDENGLVVPQKLELPKTESAAMQAVEYLVVDGPVTELLPNGFQAVLPAGTEVMGVNLEEDGTLIVDLSEDFTNYQPENEVKILQAMTHTLTQFESVDKIKLWINGENQSIMPVDGTPLSEGFSRANGINIDIDEKPNLQYSEAMTVYYPKSYDGELQFVPVTTYVNNKEDDLYSEIVQALMKGPSQTYATQEVFNDYTELVQKPNLENGVLQLEFSEEILKDQKKAIIADDVIATLVKTLTENEEVEAVTVSVNNIPTLHSESGNPYDEPVTSQDVMGKEKM